MKMEYIIFGTTYGFASTETTDEEQRYIEQFYHDDEGKRTYVHKRRNNKVYYTRTIYGDKQNRFCDSKGRPGGFFGMTIGFDGQYCRDFNKINALMDRVYENFIKKGFITEKNGTHQYHIADFQTYNAQIHEIMADAVQYANLSSADMEKFTFCELKGTYRCHPNDMPSLNKALMDMPYHIDISEKYPTQAMLREKLSKVK